MQEEECEHVSHVPGVFEDDPHVPQIQSWEQYEVDPFSLVSIAIMSSSERLTPDSGHLIRHSDQSGRFTIPHRREQGRTADEDQPDQLQTQTEWDQQPGNPDESRIHQNTRDEQSQSMGETHHAPQARDEVA